MLVVVLGILLIAFAWPAVRSEPRDVPIAVAGPSPVTSQLIEKLETQVPGGFDAMAVTDRATAVAAIEDRTVYGAIVPGPSGVEILTASAASAAIADTLTHLGTRVSPAGGPPPTIVDVVPAPADDPRGAGLAAGALPLVLGGIAGGAGFARVVRSGKQRVVGALAFGIASGLILAAFNQYWLGALSGSYWANSAVITLAVSSITLTLLGLDWLFGLPGLGLGAAVMLLLGNPLSGLTSAPEMLPSGWGDLGQALPPGAAGTALRSVAFFDGAGSSGAFIALSAWITGGLLLCLLGAARNNARHRAAESSPASPAHA
jgi:hypothetical protein